MKNNRLTLYMVFATLLFLLVYARSVLAAPVERLDYLYSLSNFGGVIPYNWVSLTCDPSSKEVYVVNTSDGTVRIFNDNGMEIFTFGDDEELGNVCSVALEEDGGMLLLSYVNGKYAVIQANFRGEPGGRLELKDLPKEYQKDFYPNSIVKRHGLIYLIDKGNMRVLVAGGDGVFKKAYDLAEAAGLDKSKRSDTGIMGFSIDGGGNMLFTIPTMFKAYVLPPEGKVRSFGTRGSAPGRFNIVAGIASDDKGNYYLTDTLRAVVMVFDKDFKFQGEFGEWGFGPGNLVAPMDLAVENGKVYVTQSRARGVSVYRVFSPTEQIN